MKYLCLVYYRESDIEEMGQRQWDALNVECITCGEGLRASGHMLDGSALEPTTTATTVRVRDGKTTVTAGPYAESREVLGGFYIIEAESVEEAAEIASRHPGARHGTVEIRELWPLAGVPAAKL